MTTITKERIELFIKDPLENGLTRSEQIEVARIALASLEVEPVAEIRAHYPLGINGGKQKLVQAIGDLPDLWRTSVCRSASACSTGRKTNTEPS
ncbi:hypothetical protein LB05_23655 [Salmonella enterica]|nr:hypothetical protein [Salmonella enterica]